MILLTYLKKYWHWAILGGSVLFLAIHYMPAVYLDGLNSDMLIPMIFYQDIVQQGHSFQGWVWGGSSFLFPDLLLTWTLNFLLHDGITALQVATALLFLSWIGILSLAYRASNGKRMDVFAALTVLFAVAIAGPVGIHAGFCMSAYLTDCHGGELLLTMGCFALMQWTWLRGHGRGFWFLSLFVMLGTLSDALFILTFTVPAIGTLALAMLWYPARSRLALALTGNILFFSMLGFLLVPYVFPVPVAPGYTGLRLEAALNSLRAIWQTLDFSRNGVRAFCLVLDLLMPVLYAVGLGYYLRRNRRGSLSAAYFLALTYGTLLILVNWSGAILTGNFTGVDCYRYVMCALVSPWLLAIGSISEFIPWAHRATQILFVAVSLLTVTVALSPPQPSFYYREAQQVLPVLRSVMAREHIEAGLANYWYANCFTYLSGQTVPIREITEDGHMGRWINNLQWFAGDGTPPAPPSFRFIAMYHLNSTAIGNRYGLPSRIIQLPGVREVWIYSPEDAIRYSPIFGDLGNRHTFASPTQFHVSGAALPFSTGQVENGAIIARAGRDRESYVTYGPYLHTQSGRYRVDFMYAYEIPPSPEKVAMFDCIVHPAKTEKTLDQAPLPFFDTSEKIFTREILVPVQNSGDSLETRILYRGSGDLRVDSLTITYLGAK
jgi:hypothetical protein